MAWIVVALIVAAALAWWVVHRSTRLRRETEAREARMLEALFAARRGGGAEAVDVEGVFGARGKAAEPADELLREARLQAEIAAVLGAAEAAEKGATADQVAAAGAGARAVTGTGAAAGASAVGGAGSTPVPDAAARAGAVAAVGNAAAAGAPAAMGRVAAPAGAMAGAVAAPSAAAGARVAAAGGKTAAAGRAAAEPVQACDLPGGPAQAVAAGQQSSPAAADGFEPGPAADASGRQRRGIAPDGDPVRGLGAEVPVRDLVQVFYEARGFRAAPAVPSAQPIELVLTHKSDPRRAYAFAPIAGGLSAELVAQIVRRARATDQLRVLIAVEAPLAAEVAAALPAQGVRVFDRAAMQAQLARLDPALAETLLAAARRRAAQRRAA